MDTLYAGIEYRKPLRVVALTAAAARIVGEASVSCQTLAVEYVPYAARLSDAVTGAPVLLMATMTMRLRFEASMLA